MSNNIFHFTIGPVQAFVSQARRTRDFWAGSFLLSWLSGQAIFATLKQNAKITFPQVGNLDDPRDPLLAAILNKPLTPQIGSLPNRFRAEVPSNFDPAQVRSHVQQQWEDLATAVWDEFLSPHAANGNGTRSIWERQIAGFWDMQWVLGSQETDAQENEIDGSWLDVRKNWRSHWPLAPEGGDHCTIMGEWQELSGFIRSLKPEREQQDKFWQSLQGLKQLGRLELRDGERLCAIAAVKRFFPKLSPSKLQNTIGWIPGGRPEVVGNWPSTAYLSALPWLIYIASDDSETDNRKAALHQYAAAVESTLDKESFPKLASEQAAKIPGLEPLRQSNFKVRHCFPDSLDGNLYLPDALANPRATPLSDTIPPATGADEFPIDPDAASRERLLGALTQCNMAVGGQTPIEAPTFYALLLLDGDNLGKLLQNKEYENSLISEGLLAFSTNVDEIVSNRRGKTLYAGGDDVLALLPIHEAVLCAIELRKAYREKVANLFPPDKAGKITASAAIIFAQFHIPLRDVIAEGHRRLDNVAKDGNGRNSLALALLKPGGVTEHWVANIEHAPQRLLSLQQLIRENRFSTGFFYNLRMRYPMLTGEYAVLPELDPERILFAEHCKGRKFKNEDERAQAQADIKTLADACRFQLGTEQEPDTANSLQLGGVLIARFIVENAIHFSRQTEI